MLKKAIKYLQNQEIELRVRMLFFLEYVVLFATIVGTIVMAVFSKGIFVLIPNFIMFFFSLTGLYLSHVKKKYDAAAILIVIGGDYFALPYMFFTSGGNKSGMPIWFIFGLVFTCMMMRGKLKILMSTIGIIISSVCMLLGQYHPELVEPLENSEAEFVDSFQSFLIVSIILCSSLMMYFASYDRQRRMLEKKSKELKKTLNTDTLTGIANRHAFYEDSAGYTEGVIRENLVLVTLDINGLKTVNDRSGHAAGDNLIKATAEVLTEAFSKYGNIYRTGGDEFVAILSCSDEEADRLSEVLKAAIIMHCEKTGINVSVSMGIAIWNQNMEMNFFELEKLADANMYKNKNEYYHDSGIDRRKR